jgi:type II secretory pathway component PulM
MYDTVFLCVFACYFLFLEGALLGCQCSQHEICLRNERAYQRAWVDSESNDAKTAREMKPIGKSSPNGLRVRHGVR